MKKIIFGLLSIAALLMICAKTQVSASEIEYVNLIDSSKICYDLSSSCFKLNQTISLEANKTYSLFLTSNFLGTSDQDFYFEEKLFDVSFTDKNGTREGFGSFYQNEIGVYYHSFSVNYDTDMIINDLVTSGYTIDTLPKDEIILFEGEYTSFKGFIKETASSDYEKVNSLTVYTEVSKPLSLSSVVSKIKAFDYNDGEITINKKTGEYNDSLLGENNLVYEATDSSGNSSEFNLKIVVVDLTAPVITGNSFISLPIVSTCPTEADIKSHFSVSDNYDTLTLDDLEIAESTFDTFIAYKDQQYTVKLKLKDKSGNTTEKDVTFNYYDTEAPVLTVKDLTVYLSELDQFYFSDIVSEMIVTASDNSGTVNISYIVVSSTTNGGNAGVATIKITATDPTKHKTEKTATLTIVDDLAPSFYVEGTIMGSSATIPLTSDDIISNIKNDLDDRGILYNDVILLGTTYNPNIEGEYDVKYMYSYGDIVNYEIGTITVTKSSSGSDTNTSPLLYIASAIPLLISGVALVFIFKKKKVSR